ncbi:MAG: barstar family protein [Betaproteobacteria bacterium]|nr:barstar family protein [Betaproteobacteria bacterium]
MSDLDPLLVNLTLSGPCATREPAATLAAAAVARGFGVYRIDLGGIGDKAALMRHLQDALQFPEWFGRNWDALEDCLTDMSWHDDVGYVLLFAGGGTLRRHDKALFHTLVDVLKSAADYWRGAERPFWAFFLDLPPDVTLPGFP